MNKARREKDLIQVLFCLYKMEKLDMLNTECQGEGEAYENIKRFRYYWAKDDGPQQLSHGWGCAAGEDCGPYRRAGGPFGRIYALWLFCTDIQRPWYG